MMNIKQRPDNNLLPTRTLRSDNDQRRRRIGEEAVRSDHHDTIFRSSANSIAVAAPQPHQQYHYDERQQHASKRRRVRQLLLLASIAFVGLLVIDCMAQFNDLPDVRVKNVYHTAQYHPQQQQFQQQQRNNEAGFVRKLVGSFLGEEEEFDVSNKHRPHIIPTAGDSNQATILNTQSQKQRALLHRIPLLPKHSLQHRQRRELMASSKPIPRHLREGHEDEMYHAPPHQRRRVYPIMMKGSNRHLVDGVMGESNEGPIYETGALYQGYGTHYMDLWVGSPPQRQTVIVDTGSSITAFPCSGCDHCGDNPSTGELYHLDENFDKFKSQTYEQFECVAGEQNKHNVNCPLGVCQRSDPQVATSDQVCKLSVSYAEGSSWTAIGGSDVCYPAGPHQTPLLDNDTRKAEGVGVGMGEIDAGKEFDWMDFRLQFGCQTKVTGLFISQLEDGIMGMDNRAGAFWMQLRDHYRSHRNDEVSTGEQEFDPNQFALCYDRQPISSELTAGVGSGALTFGGSDSLLHLTPMVYADNVTPNMGWYTVHVKGIFLRSKGGSLSADPVQNARYIRVDADETTLNGNTGSNHGIIVDSGTTDTYLPSNLKHAFLEAWKDALRNPNADYHNNHIEMTSEQVKSLPTILVVLQGHDSNTVHNNENVAIGMAGHSSHAAMFNSITDKTPLTISKNDVVIAIPPEHYMEESHRTPGTWIARIYFTERFGQQPIFGSSFMMGHEILFDNSAGRLGFSESHCDYSRYKEERDTMLERINQSGQYGAEAIVEGAIEEVALNSAQLEGQDDLHASGWA